jgi:hypothetical protein
MLAAYSLKLASKDPNTSLASMKVTLHKLTWYDLKVVYIARLLKIFVKIDNG